MLKDDTQISFWCVVKDDMLKNDTHVLNDVLWRTMRQWIIRFTFVKYGLASKSRHCDIFCQQLIHVLSLCGDFSLFTFEPENDTRPLLKLLYPPLVKQEQCKFFIYITSPLRFDESYCLSYVCRRFALNVPSSKPPTHMTGSYAWCRIFKTMAYSDE